jgi:hypothetical protein
VLGRDREEWNTFLAVRPSCRGVRFASDRCCLKRPLLDQATPCRLERHLGDSLPGLVSGQARRYVEGSKVDVHYDPANPAAAVLECRVRGLWLLWVCSLGFLGGAAFLVGLV